MYFGVSLCLLRFNLNKRESLCHSGWITLCLIYIIYKALFLLSIPSTSFYIDLTIDGFVLFFLFKNLKSKIHINFSLRKELKTWISKLLFLLFLIPLAYGFILAVLISPVIFDVNAYHESRILLMQQQETYFLHFFNDICETVYGLGYDLVLHNHLRFGEDRSLAIYGYVCFLCIAGLLYDFFGRQNQCYQLYWLPTVLFLGLIEPVYQSLSAKNDLPGVLACLGSFHLYYKWKKSPSPFLLFLSILAITWAVSCKKVYLAYAIPMIIIWLWEWYKNKDNFSLKPKYIYTFAGILLFTSPIFIYVYNILLWGNWSGPELFLEHHKNQSLFYGTIANFFRYMFEIIHLPAFIEIWSVNQFNFSLVHSLNQLWESSFHPIFKDTGVSTWPFTVEWEQLEDSWFGPFGICLTLLFFLNFCIQKTSKELRILFILTSFLLCICIQLSWRPFNDRYFTLFFVFCSLLSHNLQVKSLGHFPIGKPIIVSFSLILLYWATFFNKNAITFNFASLDAVEMVNDSLSNSVLARTNGGSKKLGYPLIPPKVLSKIKGGDTVGVWCEGYQPIASITRQLHNKTLIPLRYVVKGTSKLEEPNILDSIMYNNCNYLLFFGKNSSLTDLKKKIMTTTIWKSLNVDNSVWTILKLSK